MDGQGILLCINEQWIKQAGGAFSLERITVNVTQRAADFTQLVSQLAKVVPGLWGYVGIDLIVGEVGFKVLEVNPRLTTSYAGIRAALGGNLGASIVAMLTGEMNYIAQYDQSVTVEIPQEEK
jgi:predicted ATP-grasp superfamily ATP-dependent carboligase